MIKAEPFARTRSRTSRVALLLATFIAASAAASAAAADDVKQSCLEAHSEGQDEKEQGHIVRARGYFTMCAQASCPTLVKDDCARFLDELERAQPSLGFSARDQSGGDLPDTSVFVDGVLLISRLDGMWHEIDPGMHVVRFEHDGRRQEQSVIVGAGEKARVIVGVFDAVKPPAAARPARPTARRVGPALAIGASAALVAVGGGLLIAGLVRVPDNCSVQSHECAAPPGDAAFDAASRAVRLSNVGWGVGAAGLVALTASLVWYFKAPKASERQARRSVVTPFADTHGAGIALSGRL